MRFFWFLFFIFGGLFVFLGYSTYMEINNGLVIPNSYVYHEIPIYMSENTKKLNSLENKNLLKGLLIAFLIFVLLFCFLKIIERFGWLKKLVEILRSSSDDVADDQEDE